MVGVNLSAVPQSNNGIPGYPLLILSNASNSYPGSTTINDGILQFTNPGALPSTSTVTVASGATLALNVGGVNDYTAAQASTILSNFTTGGATGFQPGSAFGIDTSNATTAQTISTSFSTPTIVGPGIWKAGAGTLNLLLPIISCWADFGSPAAPTPRQSNSSTSSLVSINNATAGGTSILGVLNSNAFGPGTTNGSLPGISMDAYGTALSASILLVGATIGHDPGGNAADFSYTLLEPETLQAPTNFIKPGTEPKVPSESGQW